eukprot:scaffold199880_cov76-Cyclotella_meneghiniana.AAC.2
MGIKTVEYDKAKRVGIPSFRTYLESKPSAIASAPMLDDNNEVPPEAGLQPRVSAASKERYVSFESMSSSASYETPKSADVIDLTVDVVDLTAESPRPTKKSKRPAMKSKPDYHGLHKCGVCGKTFEFQDELEDHKCKTD